ncbi:uncharacterized protein [Ptychodera flava]|uniref:uncharacterized protein n=1 Tax=Ptychodera flava TaxID=63121 RepID=UPI00396AAA24
MRTISALVILTTLASLHDSNYGMKHIRRDRPPSSSLRLLGYQDLDDTQAYGDGSVERLPRTRTNYITQVRNYDRSGLPEDTNNIYDIQGAAIRQELEDEILPPPDLTYLAPGERVDDVIEWDDGTFNVISSNHGDSNINNRRQKGHKSVQVVRPSGNLKGSGTLEHALISPPKSNGRVHGHSSGATDDATKVVAKELLSMLNSECVIGEVCSEDIDCCASHTCRRYSDDLLGNCFPRCDVLVSEGGNCNMCACAKGLECTEIPVAPAPFEKMCLKPIPQGKPCSDNNECEPGECCLMKPDANEGAISRCHRNLGPHESCRHVQPHPFMNLFEVSCPCDHSTGVVCIDGTCGRRH